jgi:uncharacterized membrane protein
MIFLASHLNVWEDEVYSLNTSSKTFQYALHQSIYFESQPPVYFLILTLWRFFSDSILWARLLSVFLTFLSLGFLYQFIKKIATKKIATLFSILFLLNPLTVFTLLEIRTYALVLFLSLLITIIFYNTYYNDKTTLTSRLIFSLVAIVALFTQYYLGFLLFANGIVLISTRKSKALYQYLLDMIIPLILILFYLPQILLSLNVHSSSIVAPVRSFNGFMKGASTLLLNSTFGRLFPFNLTEHSLWYWIFRGIIIILLIVSVKYSEIKDGLRSLTPFVLIFIPLYFLFSYILWAFGESGIANKYTTVMFIPVFMVMVFLFARLIKTKTLNLWFIILVLLSSASNFHTYNKLYKVNDYRSLASYLEEHGGNQQPIFVYRNITAENLSLYYKGSNEIVPLPRSFPYDETFGPDDWIITNQDIVTINEKMNTYNSFYVIVEETGLSGFSESKKALIGFLFTHYSLVEDKSFKAGIKLYKFSSGNNLHSFHNSI